ncbi:hypothetical protein [Actinomadura sp. 9N407]|uniref:hypothetical protein n=1 Tax=Actinomadura sp. 9N407 TaxID=3375154 RepID=UPI003796F2AB
MSMGMGMGMGIQRGMNAGTPRGVSWNSSGRRGTSPPTGDGTQERGGRPAGTRRRTEEAA